jgi:hypothetical protein
MLNEVKHFNYICEQFFAVAQTLCLNSEPLMSFTELTRRMSKNEAIVRIAHKLLNRIRYLLKNDQAYELGVVS